MIPAERIVNGMVRLWHPNATCDRSEDGRKSNPKGGWISRLPVDARELVERGQATLDKPDEPKPARAPKQAPAPKPTPAPTAKPSKP